MQGKVDVKKLKQRLSLADYKKVVQELGIPAFSESDSQIVYWSGEKNVDPLKGSPKLVFYKDNRIFVGYTSAASFDLISLVQTRLKLLKQDCGFMDAIQFILSVTNIDTESVQRISKSIHSYNWQDDLGKFIRFRSTGSTLKEYGQSILATLPHIYPQTWVDEGIGVETMAKYQIGYYERLQATTIPCFNQSGGLIGVRVRNWNEERVAEAKYLPLYLMDGTNFKFNTNDVFYGINYNWPEIERTGVVMLGESEKFVLKMDTWYGNRSVALGMYGSNIGIRRRNQLLKLGVRKVIYVADNDWIGKEDEEFEAWGKKLAKTLEIFKGYCQVEVVWDSLGLLGPKDNATDKDFETWKRLYEVRENLELGERWIGKR